ncbi:MAG: hypothetical protein AABY15_07715 [Nanoarchaeota archaeon]
MNNNHMWLMALACGGAFLLILVLPLFGLARNWSTGIGIFAMVVLHLWMMKGHSHNHSNHTTEKGGEI